MKAFDSCYLFLNSSKFPRKFPPLPILKLHCSHGMRNSNNSQHLKATNIRHDVRHEPRPRLCWYTAESGEKNQYLTHSIIIACILKLFSTKHSGQDSQIIHKYWNSCFLCLPRFASFISTDEIVIVRRRKIITVIDGDAFCYINNFMCFRRSEMIFRTGAVNKLRKRF